MIPIHESILQYGFAGVCLILIGVLCWIIKLFLGCVRAFQRALQGNTSALQNNTSAIVALTGRQAEVERNLREIRDETLRHGNPFAAPPAAVIPHRQLVGT